MKRVRFIYSPECPNVAFTREILHSVPGISIEEVDQSLLSADDVLRHYSSPSVLCGDKIVYGVRNDGEGGSCSIEPPGLRNMRKLISAALKLVVLLAAITVSGVGGADEIPKAVEKLGVQELKDSFNQARDSVRLVTLLSPTCRHCQAGQQVVKELFSEHPSKGLKGYLVWLPILSPDSSFAATSRSALSSDSRIRQGWDADRAIGKVFKDTLKLPRTAWDVYLVYAPGVRWVGELPPPPTFWMHQLRKEEGGEPKLFLNSQRLSKELSELLAKRGHKARPRIH